MSSGIRDEVREPSELLQSEARAREREREMSQIAKEFDRKCSRRRAAAFSSLQGEANWATVTSTLSLELPGPFPDPLAFSKPEPRPRSRSRRPSIPPTTGKKKTQHPAPVLAALVPSEWPV